jgi:hypothetical protein
MTIKFGHKLYDEYFNVANVEYYDTILGTLFLRKRKLGITLDFSSLGIVRVVNESVPIGKKSADNESSTEGQQPKAGESTPESRTSLAN